ncbi:hypothetical protein UFOVP74_39 [uncultured Caudovirales phage]|uniref:Uncharacterized protein n=1 Tax=uncultured Caudovirales phage TaxID=2100421 RepID=A0A6J5KYY3_9CAUD|nr:hypothetical protein UFOVP74_39 [uncultured Caudovirales phage]
MAEVKLTKIGQQVLYSPSKSEKHALGLADKVPAIAQDEDAYPTLNIFTGVASHPILVKHTVSYKGEPSPDESYWEEQEQPAKAAKKAEDPKDPKDPKETKDK